MKANIQALIESARRHREADDYIKGSFGDIVDGTFKGCSVGCTIRDIDENADTSDHDFLADQLGVPVGLIYLQEWFFENLEDNRDWTVDFLSAIPKTPRNVIPLFLLEIVPVVDAEYYELTKKYLEDWAKTGAKDEKLRSAARSAARSAMSAARSVARSAAESAARSAARSAMSAARSVARSAAESAADSAAWSAARSAAWSAAWLAKTKDMSETLLNIMRGEA